MTKLTSLMQKKLENLRYKRKKHRQIQGSVPIKLTISQQPKAAEC